MLRINGLRIFAGFVITLVIAAIAGGLYLSGSPNAERSRQFDSQRLAEVQQIAAAVDSFYARNNRLPADLKVLMQAAGTESYLVGSLEDPQTKEPYGYEPQGDSNYLLCAIFDLASETADQQELKQPMPVREPLPPAATAPLVTEPLTRGRLRTWEHPSGHFCFELNATDTIGSVQCGLRNPCAAGQTCATLPDNKGTLCVPQGHECEAAGCPGQCLLAESYPVQVTCAQPKGAASSCVLMRQIKTGEVDCYGCAQGACTSRPADWEDFAAPAQAGYVGIPYSCQSTAKGCQLVQ
ncbi:MAG: hypothetical protein WCT10_04025 [Patescibacteria group bacterium]|jgi:outer membrane murein-binding lipoprotein Lpp